MAKQNLSPGVLVVGGAAALAGYQFILKPLLAAKSAAATPLSTLWPSSPAISTPTNVGPSLTPSTGGQYQGSIIDPRTSPGGDVGQAMWRKNWTQAQASARLDALKKAAANAQTMLAQLRQAGAPSAQVQALVSAGQAELGRIQAVAANDRLREAQALTAGDAAGAQAWGQAAADHEGQAREIAARISATSAAATADNGAAIVAWEGALAGHKADYLALTGYSLAV